MSNKNTLVLILLPRMPHERAQDGRSIRPFRNLLKTQEARDGRCYDTSELSRPKILPHGPFLPWRCHGADEATCFQAPFTLYYMENF